MQWLESARGVAAILVVLFHGAAIMKLPKYFGKEPLGGFFEFGYAGVDFFFVLSGFIMLYIHYEDINKPKKYLIYLSKRFIRIYPFHWAITCLFLLGIMIYPFGDMPDINKILSSFLLLPQKGYPVGVVAWTLIHEVIFYIIFGFLIVSRKTGIGIIIVWLTGIVVYSLGKTEDSNYLYSYLFSLHNLEFILGMFVALLVRKWKAQALWKESGIVGISMLVLAIWVTNSVQKEIDVIQISLYALGSALIIYAMATGEISGILTKPKSWLVFLGTASYSVYLIQFLALSVLCKVLLLIGSNDWMSLSLNYLIISTGSVVIGLVTHVVLEKPVLEKARAIVLKSL